MANFQLTFSNDHACFACFCFSERSMFVMKRSQVWFWTSIFAEKVLIEKIIIGITNRNRCVENEWSGHSVFFFSFKNASLPTWRDCRTSKLSTAKGFPCFEFFELDELVCGSLLAGIVSLEIRLEINSTFYTYPASVPELELWKLRLRRRDGVIYLRSSLANPCLMQCSTKLYSCWWFPDEMIDSKVRNLFLRVWLR